MSYDLGSVYVSNIAVKQMIEEQLYGKPAKAKKPSFMKKFFRKITK